jgi:hypothetical protein
MHLPLAAAALVGLALCGLGAPARAGAAHEHGVARLDIGVEPGRITLDLDSPLDNLIGFEHAPRNEAEQDRVKAALGRLRAAAELFRIDAAAACQLGRAELQSPLLQLGPPAAAGAREGHADLEAHFEFHCHAGARASFVEVGLFEAFPALRRIELQLVLPKGQMKATLLRPASRVALVR